jgi:hypothetical protein
MGAGVGVGVGLGVAVAVEAGRAAGVDIGAGVGASVAESPQARMKRVNRASVARRIRIMGYLANICFMPTIL